MHVIAGKAAAFGEALRPEFRAYQSAVVENAKVLAQTLVDQGLAIVTGGTDSHLLLVDLRPKHVTGKAAEASLERAHITANKNAYSVRSGKTRHYLGHPPRHAGGNHARVRACGIPRSRADDRRSARGTRARRSSTDPG